MYFLSEEEKRYLLRKLLPEARQQGVAEELRGWRWAEPPLSPVYDLRLGVYEIAGHYCPTSRDLYLRRVLGIKKPPSRPMVEGGVLHQALCHLILEAKRAIYNQGGGCLAGLRSLASADRSLLEKVPQEWEEGLRNKLSLLWDYEYHRVMARVQEVLARQPHLGADALASLALPVIVEQRLDGAFLGLSSHLSADAFAFSEPMVVDLKFGRRQKFHRLETTGYALVMESLYEYPLNVGCVCYVTFRGDHLQVERDFHPINDELRQWFVEERDEHMRMVVEEIDPGVGEDCPEEGGCPYWGECH